LPGDPSFSTKAWRVQNACLARLKHDESTAQGVPVLPHEIDQLTRNSGGEGKWIAKKYDPAVTAARCEDELSEVLILSHEDAVVRDGGGDHL